MQIPWPCELAPALVKVPGVDVLSSAMRGLSGMLPIRGYITIIMYNTSIFLEPDEVFLNVLSMLCVLEAASCHRGKMWIVMREKIWNQMD